MEITQTHGSCREGNGSEKSFLCSKFGKSFTNVTDMEGNEYLCNYSVTSELIVDRAARELR